MNLGIVLGESHGIVYECLGFNKALTDAELTKIKNAFKRYYPIIIPSSVEVFRNTREAPEIVNQNVLNQLIF